MTEIKYSIVKGVRSTVAEPHAAESFRAFYDALTLRPLWAGTPEEKAALTGPLFAPQFPNNSRAAKSVPLGSAFCVIDYDQGNKAVSRALQQAAAAFGWSFFCFTTASHTEEQPHIKLVIELDREATAQERLAAYDSCAQRLSAELTGKGFKPVGGAGFFDPTARKPEHLQYVPGRAAKHSFHAGAPVSVDKAVSALKTPLEARAGQEGAVTAPACPTASKRVSEAAGSAPIPRADEDPVLNALLDRGLTEGEVRPDGGIICTCPFEDEHTEKAAGNDTSCVYYPPTVQARSDKQGKDFFLGRIVCLHAHCQGRTMKDYCRRLRVSYADFVKYCRAAQNGFKDEEETRALLGDPEGLFPQVVGKDYLYVPEGRYYYAHKMTDKGNDNNFPLCTLIRVTGQYKAEDQRERGLMLEVYGEDDDPPVEISVSKDLVTKPDRLVSDLVNAGLEDKALSMQNGKRLICELIANFPKDKVPSFRGVDYCGWVDGSEGYCFMKPGGEVLGACRDGMRCFYTGREAPDESRGSLEEWQQKIALPALKSSRVVACLGVGFAGALFRLIGMPSRGLNIVGKSGVGKSTGLKAACSIYGSARPGLRFGSCDTSRGGAEAIMARANGTLAILDEVQQGNPKFVEKIALTLGNEAPRTRQSINLTLRRQHSWSEGFLSSSEIPPQVYLLRHKITMAVGAERRVPCVEAQPKGGYGCCEREGFSSIEESAKWAAQLKRAAEHEAYGTAGNEWLKAIIASVERDGLEAWKDHFFSLRDKAGARLAPGKLSRLEAQQLIDVRESFEAYAAALLLAREYGILPPQYTEEAIFKAIGACWESAASTFRGTAGEVQDIAEAILGIVASKADQFDATAGRNVLYKAPSYQDRLGIIFSTVTDDASLRTASDWNSVPDTPESIRRNPETVFFIPKAFKDKILEGQSINAAMRFFPAECFAGNEGESRPWYFHAAQRGRVQYAGMSAGQRYLAFKVEALKRIAEGDL